MNKEDCDDDNDYSYNNHYNKMTIIDDKDNTMIVR